MVREYIPQDEWEYYNSLNIQFRGKHKTANEYSVWVIDREREIIFTNLQLAGRDYGDTYILIWGKSRIYITFEGRPTRLSNGTREFRCLIENITAPLSLKDKRDELINLIKEVSDMNYDRRTSSPFVIVSIAEPKFVLEE